MILHTRTQLMNWLEENAPTASIRRAVGEGSVEFLGWFEKIPGSIHPGWIVKVISTITGIVWNVVTRSAPFNDQGFHAWMLIEDIPWAFWNPTDSVNPFLWGDNPEIYRQNRENAQTQGRTTLHQEDISS